MVKKEKRKLVKKKFFLSENTKIFLKQFFFWLTILIFFFLVSLIFLLTLIFRERVLPRIYLGSVDIGGKTRNQAIDLLKKSYENFYQNKIRLVYEGKEWLYYPSDWQAKIEFEKSVDQALSIGRTGLLKTDLNTLFKLQKETVNLPLIINLNEELFTATAAAIAEEVEIPMIPASLFLEEGKVTITRGISGRRLDRQALKEQIIRSLNHNLGLDVIVLPVVKVEPPASAYEEEQTLKRASLLLSKKLELIIEDRVYEIEKQEMVNLLSFLGGFDVEKVASLTANLATAFDKQPQNAAFNFENGRVTVFKPSVEGRKIDQETATAQIIEALIQLEATSSAKLTINLPVLKIPPEISTAEVNDLGIKELIGRGVSYFKGSIASRIHNLTLAATRLNGVLIKPGEIFSFNQAVGEISTATGYQQAYIIQNGRTVLGDGGGVCQVSTTLFRAALNAGLPIVERQAHAYRVSYYEQGGFKPGLDATVFAPSVDLKIKNDTPAFILIQMQVDKTEGMLVFELYGSSDGRIAEISTPRVWDQIPPPPPRYEDDPTLPIGTEKQVDWPAWGAKAAFDYKVVRGEEVLINKTFYSNFKPWQAVFLRGTKQL